MSEMAEKSLPRKHWSLKARKSLISRNAEGNFCLEIEGGAENGQFLLIRNVKQSQIKEGKVRRGELLLEVNQKRVPGMIKKDVMALIENSLDPVSVVTVKKSAAITRDLKMYLATRFPENSVDIELQEQIRENLHTRVVPCTTRLPQEGEHHGIDFNFISVKEFKQMDKSRKFLESGVYEGNSYGTPKPSSDPPSSIPHYVRSPATSGYSRGALIPSGSLSPPSHAPSSIPHYVTSSATSDYPMHVDYTDSQYLYPYQQPYEQELEAQLQGEVIKVALAKTASSVGFTIIGGEIPGELLQIGSIDKGGTSDRDGRLSIGDVLVRINGISVLSYSHWKVLELFQSLPLNSQVIIEVCRGYPLPNFQNKLSALISIYVVKGPCGFGFSLGESQMGPVVRQIIDHSRCAQLREGDIILEINGENVRNYAYSDLVTVLKRCPTGNQANFIVLREPPMQQEPTLLPVKEPVDVSIPLQPGTFEMHVVEVQLTKQITGLGFKVAGGNEEGTQATVGAIDAGGAADLDGRLLVGDEITSINGQSVMDASHRDVISLMREAAAQGEVVLRIRRKMPIMGVRDVVIHRPNVQTSFGFSLLSNIQRPGSMIGCLVPDSQAENCGQLYIYDELLAVNEHDVSRMDHGDIVALINASGTSVQLTVQQPEGVERIEGEVVTQGSQKQDENTLEDTDSEDEKIHHVKIHRDAIGFGFSIRGGAEYGAPLCVGMIAERGVAKVDGRLCVGDELLEINGYSTKNMLFTDAFTLLYGADLVKLTIRRVPNKQPLHTQGANALFTDLDDDSQQLFDEAMEKGHVNSRMVVCLFTGAAGSGKSHFMRLVLGQPPPAFRQSTPLAESAVRAISISRATVSSSPDDSTMEWHAVTLLEVKHMISEAIKAGISVSLVHLPFPQIPHSTASAEFPSAIGSEMQSHEVPVHSMPSTSRGCLVSGFQLDTELPVDESVGNAFEDIPDTLDSSQLLSIRQLEREFVNLISRSSGSRQLFEVDWVYLIDSGGQPQFTEILPAFVHNASAAIFVMKLNQLLSERPTVEYYGKDGQRCGCAYTSLLTNEQILMRNLQAMQSHQCMSDGEKSASVFIVGSHKDLEHSCSETRAQKDAKLINILRPDLGNNLAFHRLSIPEELIFPVNSKTPTDEDHKVADELRQEIMKLHSERSVKIPLPWFVFEQFVREFADAKGVSILSKGECQQIAQGLYMSEEECDAALGYLVKLNIFLYYKHLLPNVVFCESQVLLDKISELVEFCHHLRRKPDDKQPHHLPIHIGDKREAHSLPVHGDKREAHSLPVHGDKREAHSLPVHGGEHEAHSLPVHGGEHEAHSLPVHGGEHEAHSLPVHGGEHEAHSLPVHGDKREAHSLPVHGDKREAHSLPVHGDKREAHSLPVHGDKHEAHSLPVHGDKREAHSLPVHGGEHETHSLPVHGDKREAHSLPVHGGDKHEAHSLPVHGGDKHETHSLPVHGGEHEAHSLPVHGGEHEAHSLPVHGGEHEAHSLPVHGDKREAHSLPVHGDKREAHSLPVHGDKREAHSLPVHGDKREAHSLPVHGDKREAHSLPVHGAEWVKFRDYGILTIDSLRKFPKHYMYIKDLFTPRDLLKILIGLNVTAPISKSEYIMPCLLPELAPDEIDAHRQLDSPSAAPLLVKYQDKWVPAGCFTILISYLQNTAHWKLLLCNNIPSCLYRNCTTFLLPTRHQGLITLIDSFEYLELHVQVSHTNSVKVCPRIRNDIFNGLKKAAEILRYGKLEPEMAFFCPQKDDACKPELHLACIADSEWTCTEQPTKVGGKLTDRHTVWLGSPFSGLHYEPTEPDLMNAVAVKVPHKWREVGCELGLPAEELMAISDSQPRPLRCFSEVFGKWKTQKTAPYTWATIIKALQAPQVNQIRLADTLKDRYTKTFV